MDKRRKIAMKKTMKKILKRRMKTMKRRMTMMTKRMKRMKRRKRRTRRRKRMMIAMAKTTMNGAIKYADHRQID